MLDSYSKAHCLCCHTNVKKVLLNLKMLPSDFHSDHFNEHANAAAIERILSSASSRPDGLLYEYEAYELFELIGIKVPEFRYFPLHSSLASQIKTFMKPNQKYVIKCHIPGCLHKTDIGGIMLFKDRSNIEADLEPFVNKLKSAGHNLEGVIVVEMAKFYDSGMSNGELLISVFEDSSFGPCLCFGLGGTAIEYYGDVMKQSMSTVFLPVFLNLKESKPALAAIERLPVTQFLLGEVRGSKAQVRSFKDIVSPLANLAECVRYYSRFNPKSRYVVTECEINPTVVEKGTGSLLALDGVVRVAVNPNFGKPAREISLYKVAKPLYKMGYLFAPRSVCLAGVSTKVEYNPMTVVCKKFLNLPDEMRPEIVCIHPTAKEIFGNKVYPSISAMMEDRKACGLGNVDLTVVGIPAASAGAMMQEIIDLNATKAVFVMSGGFSETEAGKESEDGLKRSLAAFGNDTERRMIINGPNTVGYKFSFDVPDADTIDRLKAEGNYLDAFRLEYLHDPATHLEINTVFLASYKSSGLEQNGRRNCALIAQSGAFMISRIGDLANRCRPRCCVSVGNQLCLSVTDCLEWLLDENIARDAGCTDEKLLSLERYKPMMKVIGIYSEGLNPFEGIRLIYLIAKARSQGKIVIIYKAARTAEGSSAVAGHTAALAGNYNVFNELVDMAGGYNATSADDFEDAYYTATCIVDRLGSLDAAVLRRERAAKDNPAPPEVDSHGHKKAAPNPSATWISGQSNAGYEKCAMADHMFALSTVNCSRYLSLPQFDEPSKLKIAELFNKYKVGSVVDIQDILDTTAILPDLAYDEISRALLSSPAVDAAVIGLISETHVICTLGGEYGAKFNEDCVANKESVVNRYINIWHDPALQKPWVFCNAGGWKYDELKAHMTACGLPVFPQVDRGSRALTGIIRCWRGRDCLYTPHD